MIHFFLCVFVCFLLACVSIVACVCVCVVCELIPVLHAEAFSMFTDCHSSHQYPLSNELPKDLFTHCGWQTPASHASLSSTDNGEIKSCSPGCLKVIMPVTVQGVFVTGMTGQGFVEAVWWPPAPFTSVMQRQTQGITLQSLFPSRENYLSGFIGCFIIPPLRKT